jgi:hypothetical protein
MARKKSESSKPAKSADDKAASFARLANQRTNKALKAIRQLKHLANPSVYVYNEEQVAKVLQALAAATHEVAESFANPKAAKSEGFQV